MRPSIDLDDPECFLGEQSARFKSLLEKSQAVLDKTPKEATFPGLMVCDEDPLVAFAQMACALRQSIPVFLGNPSWQPSEWNQVKEQGAPLPSSVSDEANPQHQAQPGDIFIPTGGSSGKIKFARHTIDTLGAAAKSISSFFENAPIHSWSHLPHYHISGLMPWLRALASGGKVTYGHPRPNLSDFPREGLKTTSIVGTQLSRIFRDKEIAYWKGYDIIFIGGSPVPLPLLENARNERIPLSPCYGSTETAAMVSCLPPKTFLDGKLNAGRPLPHANITIDEQKHISISSPSLFKGYWNDRYIDPGNYWETDDLGHFDENDFLHIEGRADNIIISGGEKIDPRQVEEALLSIQGIQDAIILAEPHPEWGSQVVCIAQLNKPDITEQSLKENLKRTLAPFKIPKKWIFVEAMPYNAQGKRDPKLISTLLKTHA